MAGKIPREFIEDLIARVDVVDLIDARITLKKSGANYSARCPFHSEKTPSFTVSRDKQFYHCFGCGAHGNAISFLMDYERLSFVEAVESLAESVGLRVPVDGPVAADGHDAGLQALYDIQGAAARFFARQLRSHADAARAVAYLKNRGLSGETAKDFMLGYAPPGWHNLPASMPADQLLAAGLLIKNEQGSVYDRFRDRIMFPIRDRRGRVVAFGGRVLEEGTPKYLNSPETPVFTKHRELYGLYELLKAVRKPERILVAEGYMDVISVVQWGIPNAVATLGTATSTEHINLLFRFTKEVIFCFDGDRAGQAAAWKALEASLPSLQEGRSIRFLLLPEGHDPDSLVREEGRDAFTARMAAAVPLSDYFFAQLAERFDLTTLEGRAGLFNQARALLEKIPQDVFREMMIARLHELSGRTRVESEGKSSKLVRTPKASGTERVRPSPLRVVVSMLLRHPALFKQIGPDARVMLERLERGGVLVGKLFAFFDEKPDATVGAILERFRGEAEESQVRTLSAWNTLIPEDGLEAEFGDALKQVIRQLKHDRLEALLVKVKLMKLSEDELMEMKELLADRE